MFEDSFRTVVPLLAALGLEAPNKDYEDESIDDKGDKLKNKTSKEYLWDATQVVNL